MSFIQDQEIQTTSLPFPQFDNINYGGDGDFFEVRNGDNYPNALVTSMNGFQEVEEVINGITYKCVYLDFMVKRTIKLSGLSIKAYGHHRKDFMKMQLVVLADPENDIWVMYKEYVHRLSLDESKVNQVTPKPPYAKEIPAFGAVLRAVYCIHPDNNSNIDIALDYDLHEV